MPRLILLGNSRHTLQWDSGPGYPSSASQVEPRRDSCYNAWKASSMRQGYMATKEHPFSIAVCVGTDTFCSLAKHGAGVTICKVQIFIAFSLEQGDLAQIR